MGQIFLPLRDELVIDNFAGGGGASVGMEWGIGRPVDVAINHNEKALCMHEANHPGTKHYHDDVFNIDPVKVTSGQPIGLAWFSPDCTFHSKARGGKPFRDKKKANRRRGLANIVVKWAKLVKPRVIMLENVEEFQDWGPLNDDGKPCKIRKGMSFQRWKKSLENLGYKIEYRELRACDYGAPTIRKRLFLIARCDGLPITWPKPTHGEGLKPYRTAAECIDWSIPCPSIFNRKRPLAESTMKRIAVGLDRYVINSDNPFTSFLAKHYTGVIGSELTQPMGTVTSIDHHSLVSAFLTEHANASSQRNFNIQEPLRTQCAQVKGGHFALVQAFLINYYSSGSGKTGASIKNPLPTVTTKERIGLVTIKGVDYQIADIGMRMLAPRELFRAQGFDDNYIINPEYNNKPLTKTDQVRMCGNSVCPPVVEALVKANFKHEQQYQVAV